MRWYSCSTWHCTCSIDGAQYKLVLFFVYGTTMPVAVVALRLRYFKNHLGYTKVGLLNFCLLVSCSSESLYLFSRCTKAGLLCHLFTAASQTCSVKARGQGRYVAGGFCVLFCSLFSLSICHLVLKWWVHCPCWSPEGQGLCILCLPWGIHWGRDEILITPV